MKKTEKTIGTVTDIRRRGVDFPDVAYVCYEVNGIRYEIKETIKLKVSAIKVGFLPIGTRKTPKVKLEKGGTVTVLYSPKKPQKGHIEGNYGIVNV